ncbi:hypothetical protein D3C78_1771730 [compost metagenome]
MIAVPAGLLQFNLANNRIHSVEAFPHRRRMMGIFPIIHPGHGVTVMRGVAACSILKGYGTVPVKAVIQPLRLHPVREKCYAVEIPCPVGIGVGFS